MWFGHAWRIALIVGVALLLLPFLGMLRTPRVFARATGSGLELPGRASISLGRTADMLVFTRPKGSNTGGETNSWPRWWGMLAEFAGPRGHTADDPRRSGPI